MFSREPDQALLQVKWHAVIADESLGYPFEVKSAHAAIGMASPSATRGNMEEDHMEEGGGQRERTSRTKGQEIVIRIGH